MSTSNVYVDDSPIHGKGLFAGTFIAAGEEIGTIEGEHTETDGEHVLWIDAHTALLVQGDLRYINHSEAPNAAYYDDLKVCALKDIHPGEEITHNYAASDLTDEQQDAVEEDVPAEIRYRQHWLPWLLLALSWSAMAVWFLFFATAH